jgi:hypothetical protein
MNGNPLARACTSETVFDVPVSIAPPATPAAIAGPLLPLTNVTSIPAALKNPPSLA